MSFTCQDEITQLLLASSNGNRPALDRLLPQVYQELHRIAHQRLARERQDHTLNTTALVHEAYLKLVDQSRVEWQNRAHFFAVAAQAIRRILLDYAKSRGAAKRGGGLARVAFEEHLLPFQQRAEELIALDEALERLARIDERQSRIVEYRYFGGLTVEETAGVLGISPATVKREWSMAKAWLYREIKQLNAP